MNGRFAEEAVDIAAVVRDSIAARGGVDILRRAVDDPAVRLEAAALLSELGVWDLEPLADPVELEAAALVCHAAGHDALPYPVAERIAGGAGSAIALVAQHGERMVAHADLDLGWRAVDLRGCAYRVTAVGARAGTRLAPFGATVETERLPDPAAREAALLGVLQTWWLLGLLEHSLADTVEYTRQREQFGRPLIRFQAVGVRLASMRVEVQALREHAKYSLWVLAGDAEGSRALTEAIGLRSASLQAAREVMQGSHQLYGAMGFTDEVDVSWLSRASQAVRRLPEGEHETRRTLTERIERFGWEEYGRISEVVESEVPISGGSVPRIGAPNL